MFFACFSALHLPIHLFSFTILPCPASRIDSPLGFQVMRWGSGSFGWVHMQLHSAAAAVTAQSDREANSRSWPHRHPGYPLPHHRWEKDGVYFFSACRMGVLVEDFQERLPCLVCRATGFFSQRVSEKSERLLMAFSLRDSPTTPHSLVGGHRGFNSAIRPSCWWWWGFPLCYASCATELKREKSRVTG